MNVVHARNLELNLLPVRVAVANPGSVTAATERLYLKQSAVSAAVARSKPAIGEAVVVRHGRDVVLTEPGAHLAPQARPHLDALLETALQPARFDPRTSDRTLHVTP